MLICDEYFWLKPEANNQNFFYRFLSILIKFPIELQMIIANYTFGLSRQGFFLRDIETVLRCFALGFHSLPEEARPPSPTEITPQEQPSPVASDIVLIPTGIGHTLLQAIRD